MQDSSYTRKAILFVIGLVFLVLFVDQWSKIWVKTNMEYGEEFLILGQSWARIHFVENEGMAFGISFGQNWGKLLLTLFRIVAVGFIVYLIAQLIKARSSFGMLSCFALIFAGAVGNIIDSVFYGRIFSASPYHGGLAEMFPPEGGYADLLYGKVVDMLYFPMVQTKFPSWIPIWGGEDFEFFSPVFNVADSAITTGIIALLLFYRSFFSEKKEEGDDQEAALT
jgi:signal peptidase II